MTQRGSRIGCAVLIRVLPSPRGAELSKPAGCFKSKRPFSYLVSSSPLGCIRSNCQTREPDFRTGAPPGKTLECAEVERATARAAAEAESQSYSLASPGRASPDLPDPKS